MTQSVLPAPAGVLVDFWAANTGAGRWVLRWETMPRNRDQPREDVPPPSELRLYDLPDDNASAATRVGS